MEKVDDCSRKHSYGRYGLELITISHIKFALIYSLYDNSDDNTSVSFTQTNETKKTQRKPTSREPKPGAAKIRPSKPKVKRKADAPQCEAE